MARRVFHIPVGELRRRLSSYEFTQWVVFFEMEERERERQKRDAESGNESKASTTHTFGTDDF